MVPFSLDKRTEDKRLLYSGSAGLCPVQWTSCNHSFCVSLAAILLQNGPH